MKEKNIKPGNNPEDKNPKKKLPETGEIFIDPKTGRTKLVITGGGGSFDYSDAGQDFLEGIDPIDDGKTKNN